jgi:hypothetical protein
MLLGWNVQGSIVHLIPSMFEGLHRSVGLTGFLYRQHFFPWDFGAEIHMYIRLNRKSVMFAGGVHGDLSTVHNVQCDPWAGYVTRSPPPPSPHAVGQVNTPYDGSIWWRDLYHRDRYLGQRQVLYCLSNNGCRVAPAKWPDVVY